MHAGSIQPIQVEDFKEHVHKMHSNDDYLFSEEYNVCKRRGEGAGGREGEREREKGRKVMEGETQGERNDIADLLPP